MLQASWEPRDIPGAASNVEFENTNYLGRGKQCSRMMAPHSHYIFPGFDLIHSYAVCDAFVSIAELKEHAIAGVTLSLKNCFGITPLRFMGPVRASMRLPNYLAEAVKSSTAARANPPAARRRGSQDTGSRARWWTLYRLAPSTLRSWMGLSR